MSLNGLRASRPNLFRTEAARDDGVSTSIGRDRQMRTQVLFGNRPLLHGVTNHGACAVLNRTCSPASSLRPRGTAAENPSCASTSARLGLPASAARIKSGVGFRRDTITAKFGSNRTTAAGATSPYPVRWISVPIGNFTSSVVRVTKADDVDDQDLREEQQSVPVARYGNSSAVQLDPLA